MFRSVVIRKQILNSGLKKYIRSNIKRLLCTELTKRKRFLVSNTQNRRILAKPQWMVQVRQYADLPGHTKVNLPALSPTMEKGNIVSWVKKEGDKLNEGDLMCEIETDKATMGFETPEEGYLAKILLPAGTKEVPVGKLLCIIVSEQGDVAAFKDFKDDSAAPAPAAKKAAPVSAPAPAAAPPPKPAPAPPPKPAPAPAPVAAAAPSGDRVYASPMAKKIAQLKNIRLGGKGSGLYGSLKSTDLSGAAGAAPSGAPSRAPSAPAPGATFLDIPLSGMRATIAERLTVAKQTVPHYQLTVTVNIEKTIAMRKRVNKKLKAEKSDLKISINDFIIKAVASACKRVPDVNAQWMDSFIRQYANVDVSVAVATPTGLLTPILFNADSRGIFDLSRNMKELSQRAREGSLQPAEFQGGTVTVSNLGMFGITMFNAIINPPQSLILACGGIQEMVVAQKGSKDKKTTYANVDVNVAVATPTGLLTPILFNADSRGIFDLSRNMKELSQRAREGSLQPAEFQGGTVTVSNLGMFGG